VRPARAAARATPSAAGSAGVAASGAAASVADGPAPLVLLHVVAPAPAGGLERVVQLLAGGQATAGHRVHVAAVLGPGDDATAFLAPLEDAGVVPHVLRLPGRAYLRERSELRRLVRALAPACVHTHGYRPDVLDAPVARALAIPTVTTVHGFTGGDARNRLYERLQRRAFRHFDAVVAVSAPLAAELAAGGVARARLHAIANAWAPAAATAGAGDDTRAATRAALGIAANAFHVGWVGRLSPEKDAALFLDALARLTDLPLVASVVGDGGERRRLEERARTAGLGERVRWHGLVPSAERLFPLFDVFVLSSRTEGTPMVLFEAMHARTPIVATRVGGVPDVVGGGALLVPPGDAAALAAAMRAVHDDRAAAAARALTARARLERYGREAWLGRYEALYRSLTR